MDSAVVYREISLKTTLYEEEFSFWSVGEKRRSVGAEEDSSSVCGCREREKREYYCGPFDSLHQRTTHCH